MNILKTTSIVALALVMTVSGASAKDWISKIDLSGSIQTTPIEVKANPSGSAYSTIINKNRALRLTYDVRAKKGKRISDMEISPTSERPLFKRPKGGNWDHRFHHAAVGAGKKQAVKGVKKFSGNINGLNWVGGFNPVKACNKALSSKAKNGKSKAQVMDKGFTTSVKAKFFLHAVAANPPLAKKGKAFKKANVRWDDETAYFEQRIPVKCRAKAIIPSSFPSGNNGGQPES